MTTTLGPIVVQQFTMHHVLIERHVFPESDAFMAWLDSQEVTVYLEVQPREELIVRKSSTMWDRVHNRPADIYTPPEDRVPMPNRQDFCPGCGTRVGDFEEGAYENEFGQRGHFRCTPEYQPLTDEERRTI